VKTIGRSIVAAWIAAAVLAPWLAPYDAQTRFTDHAYAPPTRVRVWSNGVLRKPYFYPAVLLDPLQRRFEIDRTRPIALRWLSGGRLFTTPAGGPPFFLIGADAIGRDLFSRLLVAVRHSLAVAAIAVAISLLVGTAAGLLAGYRGGVLDTVLQRVTDVVIVLPVLYVLLALRTVLPANLDVSTVFTLMAASFGLIGWPVAARGVRAIAARERTRDYVKAAEAAAATPARVMLKHLLPATTGFLQTQALLLLPAFVVLEATMSFAGLGFPDHAPGWGTLLYDASNLSALGGAAWLLVPAVALASLVFGVTLALDAAAPTPELSSLTQVTTPRARTGAPAR
jgi:peptide/nickel transport system permease protein